MNISKKNFINSSIRENYLFNSTINGIEMKSSSEIEGVITSITLASGQVIAYSL